MEVNHRVSFFYTDDVLVVYTGPDWLQGTFDTLTGLYNRVGLQKNAGKKVCILCFPCRTVGIQSEASYARRKTLEGITYRARHGLWVQWP